MKIIFFDSLVTFQFVEKRYRKYILTIFQFCYTVTIWYASQNIERSPRTTIMYYEYLLIVGIYYYLIVDSLL